MEAAEEEAVEVCSYLNFQIRIYHHCANNTQGAEVEAEAEAAAVEAQGVSLLTLCRLR